MSDIYQKGGVGSEFYENKFLFCNCDIRGGMELRMTQFTTFAWFFSIFPIFGQIEYNMVSIFSKLYRFYSILVEIHPLQIFFFLQNYVTIS